MRFGRLLRFALVGVVNTGVYFAWYLTLGTALAYMYAHVCATLLAMVSSYFLNCYVTFRRPPSWRTFLLFPLSNLANVLITTAGLPLAVHWVGLPESVAPLPVALAAIPLTYLVARAIMAGRTATRPKHPLPHLGHHAVGTSGRGRRVRAADVADGRPSSAVQDAAPSSATTATAVHDARPWGAGRPRPSVGSGRPPTSRTQPVSMSTRVDVLGS